VIAVTNQKNRLPYTLPQLPAAGAHGMTKGFVLCGFSAKLATDPEPPVGLAAAAAVTRLPDNATPRR
jgi:hypothetical protein